jgi:hypothetical protein
MITVFNRILSFFSFYFPTIKWKSMSDTSFILLYTVKEFVVVGVRFTWNFGCMEFMFFFFFNYYY